MDPYQRLNRFEERHGDHLALLDRYVEEAAKRDSRLLNTSGDAERMLRAHQDLVVMCVGWSLHAEQMKRRSYPAE